MKPWMWVMIAIIIIAVRHFWKRNERKKVIDKINDRFGNIAGLEKKSLTELKTILES